MLVYWGRGMLDHRHRVHKYILTCPSSPHCKPCSFRKFRAAQSDLIAIGVNPCPTWRVIQSSEHCMPHSSQSAAPTPRTARPPKTHFAAAGSRAGAGYPRPPTPAPTARCSRPHAPSRRIRARRGTAGPGLGRACAQTRSSSPARAARTARRARRGTGARTGRRCRTRSRGRPSGT